MVQSARYKLDLRGAIIPFTLLKIRQVFGTIQPGGIPEAFWNDPDTPKDLFKILPESSYCDGNTINREGEIIVASLTQQPPM